MARYGFCGGALETKTLILFALDKLLPGGGEAGCDELMQLVFIDDSVDYFVFSQCLNELAESGQLLPGTEGAQACYAIADSGREVVAVMAPKLPAALRDECRRRAEALRREKELRQAASAEMVRGRQGVGILCRLREGKTPVFSLEMAVGGEEQAAKMMKAFENNPMALYQRVMEILDGEGPGQNGG